MTGGSGRDDAAAELAALLLSTESFDELLQRVADVLRKVSQQRNTKVRHVATDLVTAIARAGDGDR